MPSGSVETHQEFISSFAFLCSSPGTHCTCRTSAAAVSDGPACHAAVSTTASAPSSCLHTSGPSSRGGGASAEANGGSAMTNAKDCCSLQCSEDAPDGRQRLSMAALQWGGATKSMDTRVFEIFLFLNSEKAKTMAAVKMSCSTNALFSQGRYFLSNTDTSGKRLCCRSSASAH